MIVQTNDKQELVTETIAHKYVNVYIGDITDEDGIVTGYKYEQVEIDRFASDEAIEVVVIKANEKLAKEAKELALATLTVEVNGKVFDGNEKARINMLSAIQTSELLNIKSAQWKLADNTVAEATVNELKKALSLSIQRVGEIIV